MTVVTGRVLTPLSSKTAQMAACQEPRGGGRLEAEFMFSSDCMIEGFGDVWGRLIVAGAKYIRQCFPSANAERVLGDSIAEDPASIFFLLTIAPLRPVTTNLKATSLSLQLISACCLETPAKSAETYKLSSSGFCPRSALPIFSNNERIMSS